MSAFLRISGIRALAVATGSSTSSARSLASVRILTSLPRRPKKATRAPHIFFTT